MAEPLKSQFGAEVPRRLADQIAKVHTPFDADAFLHDALDGFEPLELLDRGRHLARALHRHLPPHFPDAVNILLQTLPEARDPAGGMASFFFLPHTHFVAEFGLEHFELSMTALYELTQRFTAEFSIRPFLERYPDATLNQLAEWTHDPSEHVRRLVSEGTRPRLPWASRLRAFQADPTPVLALLEMLKDDPSLYVRRSVANNLNDIGKDNPDALFGTTGRWMQDASAERRWIVSHALRSAVKAGDPRALDILGYGAQAALTVGEADIQPAEPRLGGKVQVVLTLTNTNARPQPVIADLIVHFVKANGRTSPKVFKLAVVTVEPQQSVTLRKTVSLANLTTRQHYPGVHRVDAQLNGRAQPLGAFTLRDNA